MHGSGSAVRGPVAAASALGAHLFGGHGGHHGLRIVVLIVVVVALVVGVVLLVRHSRRRRQQPSGPGGAVPRTVGPPSGPAGPASGPVSPPPRVVDPAPPQSGPAGDPGPAGHRGPPSSGARAIAVKPGHGIVARNLTKRYGNTVAVDDLSFEVVPGRVTGFLGPNGAGKSTTMRMVMGLDRPDAGSVTVNGRPYRQLPWPLREVGALLEAKATHPGRTAFSHLQMLARANRLPRRRVDEVLDLVGLSAVAGKRVGGFSLGMSQRLGIAVALLGDPQVVIFDEPVNGLDADGIRWVRQLLRHLASEGRSVFVSSHLMSEMAKTADELVVVGRGRLIAQMPVAEFTSRYARGYVRVRSPQADELLRVLEGAGASVTPEEDRSLSVRAMSQDAIGEIAWRHSIMLQELAPHSASLEEAFMESTEGRLEFGRGESLASDRGAGGAVGAGDGEHR